ncbi:MAG TPA: hypothetical protein VE398_06330 [Acidobacteriota bacterium]|nr:hypothetical protein [Acidobacteriota bacterium]
MQYKDFPTDSQIFEAIGDVNRRMRIIADVLRQRIPQLTQPQDLNKRDALVTILNAMECYLRITEAPIKELGIRELRPSEPIWETC